MLSIALTAAPCGEIQSLTHLPCRAKVAKLWSNNHCSGLANTEWLFTLFCFTQGPQGPQGVQGERGPLGEGLPGPKVSYSFMSQALGAHSFSWEARALKPVKSFEPFWPHFMHSSSIHLPTHWPAQRPRLGSRFQGVMTGNWQRVWLQEMITEHRSSINSHTAVQYGFY